MAPLANFSKAEMSSVTNVVIDAIISAAIGIIITNINNCIADANQSFLRMSG